MQVHAVENNSLDIHGEFFYVENQKLKTPEKGCFSCEEM